MGLHFGVALVILRPQANGLNGLLPDFRHVEKDWETTQRP